jgi:hypothetical protein|tara:strand:- start:15 stop:1919 length:1905 start_codon:yes stop_codon:yes gene_type:complete
MSNSGKVWDIREAYKEQRNNTWSRGTGQAWCVGGNDGAASKHVDVVTISSTGNAADFGDLTTARLDMPAGVASSTRGVCMGGQSPSYTNVIDSMQLSSAGNAADFGDSQQDGGYRSAHSNNIRGISFSIYTPSISSPYMSNVIEFVTMSNAGNATDFGDLSETRMANSGFGNNINAFSAAGSTNNALSGDSDRIDKVVIATTGNSTDYADLSTASTSSAGFGSTTRGCVAGGRISGSSRNANITQNDLTSGATGSDFGDLSATRRDLPGADNNVRGVTMGGNAPGQLNTIEFIQIDSGGNAQDFGDLTVARSNGTTWDNSSAGINYDEIQRPSVTYMPGSGRALFAGAAFPEIDTINLITIPTTGNASDFGNLSQDRGRGGTCSSLTRLCVGGGESPTVRNTIDTTEMQSQGNSADFGDLTQARSQGAGLSSQTRGVYYGGFNSPAFYNTIDYITITTAGNATDFGDITAARGSIQTCSSSTRGIGQGGREPSNTNTIEYITIASTGDVTDFGDLTEARSTGAGASSATRGVAAGGLKAPADATTNVIDYITIASTGNSTDFGDLSVARYILGGGASNSVRAVFGGGKAPSDVNTMDFITIASTGNATDYGDLINANSGYPEGSNSDSHGGLQA